MVNDDGNRCHVFGDLSVFTVEGMGEAPSLLGSAVLKPQLYHPLCEAQPLHHSVGSSS